MSQLRDVAVHSFADVEANLCAYGYKDVISVDQRLRLQEAMTRPGVHSAGLYHTVSAHNLRSMTLHIGYGAGINSDVLLNELMNPDLSIGHVFLVGLPRPPQ